LREERAEAVALAHGLRADHLDAEIEIPRHPRHHLELLEILLAEQGDIRPALREQLADDGGDPPKNCGRKRSSSPAVAGLGQDFGGEAVRIHRLRVRIPDQATFSAESFATSAFHVLG